MKVERVLIAFDPLINTLSGGLADEKISPMAWLRRNQGLCRKFWQSVIDCLFFREEGNGERACKLALFRQQLSAE